MGDSRVLVSRQDLPSPYCAAHKIAVGGRGVFARAPPVLAGQAADVSNGRDLGRVVRTAVRPVAGRGGARVRGSTVSKGEAALAMMLRAYGVEHEREYRFAPPRRWRADFAIPARRLLIEVEGGVHSGGRHVRGAGYEADLCKYNAAALAGWTVLRYSTGMVTSGEAIAEIMEHLHAAPAPDRR